MRHADPPHHPPSLSVLLVAGLLGVYFPIVFAKAGSKPFFAWTFFLTKHFGTGVILSVSFIHLLYHSFIMFGNACLGELGFEPAAPAISLAALLVVLCVHCLRARDPSHGSR